MYPPFHALASSEGQQDRAGDALEGGSELQSSREMGLTLQAPPSHDTEPQVVTAGPFGDGAWPGADVGCAVIPDPEDT